MKNAAKTAKVAEPKFDLHDFFRVTFARNQAIADTSAISSDRPAIETSDRNSVILKYLEQNASGKNSDFTKLLGLSSQRVREILQDMIKNDLIEKHGENRYSYYTVKK